MKMKIKVRIKKKIKVNENTCTLYNDNYTFLLHIHKKCIYNWSRYLRARREAVIKKNCCKLFSLFRLFSLDKRLTGPALADDGDDEDEVEDVLLKCEALC